MKKFSDFLFEAEQIDELSKKTLGSYMDKARENIKQKSKAADDEGKKGDKAASVKYSFKNHSYDRTAAAFGMRSAYRKQQKIQQDIAKRKEGIAKAASKYNKKKLGE